LKAAQSHVRSTAGGSPAGKHKATLVLATLDRLSRNVAFVANLLEAGTDFVAAIGSRNSGCRTGSGHRIGRADLEDDMLDDDIA
jgi:hypothetical protein